MMKKILQVFLSLLILLLVWHVVSLLVGRDIIIPTPASTLQKIFNHITSRQLWVSAWQTTWKVIVAILLSMLVGIPIGFFLGKFAFLYRIFRSWITVIQAVPVISWLTLVIFAWGIGWKGSIFISVLSLLPTSILTTISGIQSLDSSLLEMARFYKVPPKRVFKNIYLGSLFPFIAAILDVNIGQAWKVILVTEYLCGGNGLGERILIARMNVDTTDAWALTLIAVILGIASEILSKNILGKVFNDGTLPESQRTFKVL